ncbi:hypothetical protein [Desertibacillus haloalkaliphilus]|uniref:hypothetical protein n=1 Tax=Desertibacillus haloalkaliphilus TaxID=1328930 RepID=UPI001C263506|nr:hypothetical protein [Desertibacillus haloalkaliphilus]MBU8906481.1 hypothetical protein [Desertibacillus haloalkaliphilus]
MTVGQFLTTFVHTALTLTILVILIILNSYLFGTYGLFKIAKRQQVPCAWLAFIPVVNLWLIGEVISKQVPAPFNKHTGFSLLGMTLSLLAIELFLYSHPFFIILLAIIACYSTYMLLANLTEHPLMLTLLSIATCWTVTGFFVFINRSNQMEHLPKPVLSMPFQKIISKVSLKKIKNNNNESKPL